MSVADRSAPRDPHRRLSALLDDGTLAPLNDRDDCGMLAATGTIGGADVVAFCCDPTVLGGALGAAGCEVVVKAYERALAGRVPIIGIWHTGGARLAEGLLSLHGVGRIFSAMTRASGVIPQVSIVVGLAAGGAAYVPGLADIVVLAPQGRIYVTGPDVVRSVTGEEVDPRRLGGPDAHARRSGVAHVVAADEADALATSRALVALLAGQGTIGPVTDTDLAACLPPACDDSYDVHPLVTGLLDEGSHLELHARWAPNIVTVLGRLGGRSIGVVANNPARLGGCLDATAAEKAARFVRTCDAFGLPLAVLEDVPGYLPGLEQEWEGIVRRGAKLLHAFAEAVVPRVTVITRMAHGGAALAMNSRSLGATKVYAWPGADVAVMAPQAAVRVLHRRRLAVVPDDVRPGLEAELAAELTRLSGGVERAVALGVLDDVVAPGHTRTAVAQALAAADHGARGRHTNIPL